MLIRNRRNVTTGNWTRPSHFIHTHLHTSHHTMNGEDLCSWKAIMSSPVARHSVHQSISQPVTFDIKHQSKSRKIINQQSPGSRQKDNSLQGLNPLAGADWLTERISSWASEQLKNIGFYHPSLTLDGSSGIIIIILGMWWLVLSCKQNFIAILTTHADKLIDYSIILIIITSIHLCRI